MTGWRARSELDHGRWDDAAASATLVLARNLAAPSRVTPLTVVGRLRARRGDPDPWSPLDEAGELAGGIGELQRLAPVAGARAEARWLAGETAEIDGETAATLALAREVREPWALGELYLWRRRAGLADAIDLDAVAEPYRLELEGEYEAAGDWWAAVGCPFEAALARGHAPTQAAQRRGLAELQALGARPAAGRVARALRERGVRDVRRGPRVATRENPAGMTARARGPDARRRGLAQRRDRAAAVRVREDRRPSRLGHPAQARGPLPQPGRRRGRAPRDRRKIGSPPDVAPGVPIYRCWRPDTDRIEDLMDLYVILRRSGWRSPEELGEAAVRSKSVADEQMPDDVRWIRSYVLEEGGGSVGTVCVYEATSPEAIRKHAAAADLPVDEIIAVADTVVVRPDPQPAIASA
jgi:Protein of unknown function (DUF4242)